MSSNKNEVELFCYDCEQTFHYPLPIKSKRVLCPWCGMEYDVPEEYRQDGEVND